MKKYRNFQCSQCNKVENKRVEDEVLTTICECGGDTKRLLSAPRCFQNTVGKSPSAS